MNYTPKHGDTIHRAGHPVKTRMPRNFDYAGQVFGFLTVEGDAPKVFVPSGQAKRMVTCVCVCGSRKDYMLTNLQNKINRTLSCGCYNLAKAGDSARTHGKSWTPTWHIWLNVVARGTGKEQPEKYFNRGIRVCERWMSFENFLEDMGERPPGLSIDRINNDEGYSPENCRWATYSQQARNTSKTWMLDVDGTKVAAIDYAEQQGVPYKRFYQRVKVLGWSVEDAIATPKRKSNHE